MKKNKRILKRKEQGITLIALVITIIVLLILAGVSIAMLTGENGILTQATNAKEKTTKAEEEEKVNMAVLGSSIADNGYSEILEEASFRQELTNQFGNNGYDLVVNGDGSFIITVKESQRKYYVNDDKTVINSDNIIEISTAEELASFRDDVNSGNSYEGKAVLLTSDITLSGEWEPIGAYSEETEDNHYLDVPVNKPFKGIFDGCNHTISNLQIDSTEDYQGLFGLVIDGTIRDITIAEGSSVKAGGVSGVIVGTLYGFSGNIYNCVNNANAEFSATGGGIVGALIGQHTIYNCKNYGDITGTGGIVGSSNGTDWEQFINVSNTIINCGNYGDITNSEGNNASGIAGYFKGDILNSCNKGKIENTSTSKLASTAGIVAGFDNGKVENCYSTNTIKATFGPTGGIVGMVGSSFMADIYNCYNKGEIIADDKEEIINHYYKRNKVENCYTSTDTFTAEDLGDAFVDNPENANQPLLYWEVEDDED